MLFFLLDPEENYIFDPANPQCHGDFLVGLSINEKVKNGSKQVSSVVVAKPNTHPLEVPFLKAVITPDMITITSLAHRDDYLQNQKQWLDILRDNQGALDAEVLVTTLESMCTKLQPKDDDDRPLPPLLKTTNIIGFQAAGFTLADDYFMAADHSDVLDLLPLPYNYDKTVADENYKYSECMVVWRAFIDGSEDEVREQKKTKSGSTAMDRLTVLMKGTKI